MPDISLCKNQHCPLRDKCYRSTATPNEYGQSYATFNLNADGTCNWFWDNREYENKNDNENEKV